MAYVELHKVGDGYRFRTPDGEEPYVSSAAFIGPVLGQLGISTIGPWEAVTGEDGVQFQRAQIFS